MQLCSCLYLLRSAIINGITLAVGLGLRQNMQRNREIEARAWTLGQVAPKVEIIIPARNEAENVGPLLSVLLAQDYPAGRWGITLVDDGSTDGTAEIAARTALGRDELRVISAGRLPHGWTGKSKAMYSGYESSPPDAEWLLFVDADTRHDPYMLSSVVRRAEETSADLLSLVIRVKTESFWERVLVPQVGEIYILLVGTMDEVNSQRGRAAANGQCMLVRRDLFGRLAALPEVHSDVAEDRALAYALKARGYNVRLEYGRKLVSARVYSSLSDMWSGYGKTVFWATGQKTARTLLVVAALSLYALLPTASLLHALLARRRHALLHSVAQLAPMFLLRAWICRWMGIPSYYALAYPLGVTVGNLLLLYSFYRVRSGKGVAWKGRTYR